MRLILASTSPRRKELLSLLGLPFDLASPDYVEQVLPGKTAMDQAKEFAAGKARSCTVGSEDALVLGSDTLIGLDSEVLGKPTDLSEAAAMLRRMSGRRHVIYTGVALVGSEGRFCDVAVDTVQVTMKPFGERELAAYIETGESLGKAGAYSIQGAGGPSLPQSRAISPLQWDCRFDWWPRCLPVAECTAPWIWIDSTANGPTRIGEASRRRNHRPACCSSLRTVAFCGRRRM